MWEGKWHLVTTYHYSDWVEIDVLSNTLTATVVQLAKANFARFGIPERQITSPGERQLWKKREQWITSQPQHDHHGDVHFQYIKHGGRMRGNVGEKYSLYFGFHFDFSLPHYWKSRFIRIIIILVTEY